MFELSITKIGGKTKGGLQAYRVRIRYKDLNDNYKEIERTIYGYAEAQAEEKRLIAEYKDTKKPTQSKITINELYEEYRQYHKTETRQTSQSTMENNFRNRILPYLGDIRLDKLTNKVLADWKIKISKQDISLVTKRNGYTALSGLLNYAVKMGYITKNPLTTLGNFKDTSIIDNPAEKIQYYTPEEFLKYIAVAKKHCNTIIDWGYYVFFNILFYTGARKGEANALKWSDIDGNIIHIRRSISQKVRGKDVETPPKNKSSIRDIEMPLPLIKILKKHKERQKNGLRLFSDDYRICGAEKPLRDTTIEKHNIQFAKEAGLPHIRIHDFRHSHASLLANNGINIQEISRRLGHSNIEITWNTYSHLYPKENEKAIEILNQIQEDD